MMVSVLSAFSVHCLANLQGTRLPPFSNRWLLNAVLVVPALLSLDNKLSQRMAINFGSKIWLSSTQWKKDRKLKEEGPKFDLFAYLYLLCARWFYVLYCFKR